MPPARLALHIATIGILAMTVRALLVRPPGFAAALGVFAGYLLLLMGGVFVLRWRVFVDAVVRGPKGVRGVVLTFDDGPHPLWTPRILDALRRSGVTATFFLVGRKVEEHPDVVRAILEEGHSLGVHSYEHDRLFALRGSRRVRRDLERGIASIEAVAGRRPHLFRPPVGLTNPIIARVADDLDLTVVGWTVRGRDGWALARAEEVVARICRGLQDGAIVLLHDAPERGDREPAAVQALPAIVDAIAARGLDVVPLTEWVKGDQPDGDGSTM
ncbi:MAG: polysaccharide deacetylase family protein [Myxococcota bacterium]|nr:polysaccharide deacetylase family protein [Myxococcota bacterium]